MILGLDLYAFKMQYEYETTAYMELIETKQKLFIFHIFILLLFHQVLITYPYFLGNNIYNYFYLLPSSNHPCERITQMRSVSCACRVLCLWSLLCSNWGKQCANCVWFSKHFVLWSSVCYKLSHHCVSLFCYSGEYYCIDNICIYIILYKIWQQFNRWERMIYIWETCPFHERYVCILN